MNPRRSGPAAPPPASRLVGRTALVVDDSGPIRRELVQALQQLGIRTLQAEDGAAAWRQLQGAPVDLIVTDVHMPFLDGLKLVRLVRAGGPHQRTPIIVVSTEAVEADRRRALGLGADAHLAKPVERRLFLEVVVRLLTA